MKAWSVFLDDLEKKIGFATVDKWLRALKVIKFDACNLYLEADNHFQAKWFEEHIRPIVKKTFYNENFHLIKVHLSIKNEILTPLTKPEEQKPQFTSDPLESYLTFSFFIASEKNFMPIKLLKEIPSINAPFNPIFLYGKKGSGKTHLLQAVAQKFKDQKLNVFYINAQSFARHVVDSIRKNLMVEFRKAYRKLDVLIIDDIQILAKKLACQEEFFHTFNTLHSEKKTIILSSNVIANQLEDIEQRLISRFEWGISLSLEKLQKNELKLVLQNQANLLNLKINSNLEKYLLDTFDNIISLKKALKTIALNEHLESKSSDIQSIKKYLDPIIEEDQKNLLTPELIVKEAGKYFGITTKEIFSKSQTKECTYPRQFCMYLCRELLKLPYMKIGKIFKRDHSTVMTSIKSIQKDLEKKNANSFEAFHQISKKLSGFL